MNRKDRRRAAKADREFTRWQAIAAQQPIARPCGDCTMCCTLLTIEELDKPAGEPCTHLGPKQTTCLFYDSRPPACREYRCSWSQGFGAVTDRPDLLGLIVDVHPSDAPGAVRIIAADRRVRQERDAVFRSLFAMGHYVILVTPNSREICSDVAGTMSHARASQAFDRERRRLQVVR